VSSTYPLAGGQWWNGAHPYEWAPNGRLLVAATSEGLRVLAPDASVDYLLHVTGTDPNW
jgi:hypothetical protein